MVYKPESEQMPKTPETPAKDAAALPAKSAEDKPAPVRATENEKKKETVSPGGKGRRGFSCRTESGGYVIEPVRRPKSGRFRAAVAVMLIAVLLTGTAFYYGGTLLDGEPVYAVGDLSKNTRKTGLSAEIAELSAEPQQVDLWAVSVEKDMSIRVLDGEGFPVAGHTFEVSVADGADGVENYRDDDRDGRIYVEGIEAGDYTVSLRQMDGFLSPEPIGVTVVDKVRFEEIEGIEEKIASSSEINAEEDDPQYGNTGNSSAGTPAPAAPPPAQPEKPADTVEYVESRKEETEIVRYTGTTGENGRLFEKDGTTLTNLIPFVLDGFLTGEYELYEPPAVPPEQPEQPEQPPENPDPVGIGGAINLFETDAAGQFIYAVVKHVERRTTYFGWQDLEGKRYYFDKNGVKVTGAQVIQGTSHTFGSDGALQVPAAGANRLLGIDVSTWQNTINWQQVKASGIDFVMIRAGFRGYGTGKLVEDDLFYANLQGAKAAGLRVGVYFFTQAVNDKEAVEEASMVISLLHKYGVSLDYPIAFDTEHSGAANNGGRADRLSRAERTAAAVAFCETIRNSGYTPMIYASKSWLENNLSVSSFGAYKIWLAHYTPGGAASSYAGRYEMWQYTSVGTVGGISGGVDMNYGYLGY